LEILADFPLAGLCTLEVGGAAQYFAVAHSESDVEDALHFASDQGLPLTILGGGSNVMINDQGVPGLVLRLALLGRDAQATSDAVEVQVGAGEPWDDFVGWTVARGWAGVECLSGIPGTAGATPIQNVGAYGQDVSSTVKRVRAFDRLEQRWLDLQDSDCGFAYRSSVFKTTALGRYVVTAVTFQLTPGGAPLIKYEELNRALSSIAKPSLAVVRNSVIGLRAQKSMVISATDPNRRSCGSFFLNPVVSAAQLEHIHTADSAKPPAFAQPDGSFKVPAAWLIEHAGFSKGFARGPVGLSTRHALAIVAHEGATARDVVTLARTIRDGVRDKFQVTLTPEPVCLGFEKIDAGLPVLDG
jgi:UDP-N-acetylmuramate dehydrogenase